MNDLVKRLQAHAYALATMAPETAPATLNLLREAADRIEALETAMDQIIAHPDSTDAVVVIAGDALHKAD